MRTVGAEKASWPVREAEARFRWGVPARGFRFRDGAEAESRDRDRYLVRADADPKALSEDR